MLITLSLQKVSEVSWLSTRSLPSWFFEVSSLYSSSILVFFVSFTFAIESSRLVCDVSSFLGCEVSVVSVLSIFSSFDNILFRGINVVKSGGGHWSLLSPIIFNTDLELDPFLMETKLGILYIFSSL